MTRDERLGRLLEELTGELRRGGAPDLDRAAAEHPDLAAELRELWGAVVVSEEAARSRHGEEPPTVEAGPTAEDAGRSTPSPASPPPSGSFGDYDLVREIGRGGMGVVYEATQRSLGRQVALKVLLRGEHAGAADTARFRAEAESAAALDHPNIVPVFEVGSRDGLPFFTMRLVEGETLARRLERGPLEPREAVRIIVTVCRAVDYAHSRGVLHRDLKPSNVLIDPAGTPYVADFGLARRIDLGPGESGLTRSGAIVGTPAYMSPEQASGSRGRLGPASDVYGIGALLYHMLTGRPPVQAASAVDAILAVLEHDPLPPRLLDPAVDRDLEMIVMKCLQKPPELRYATARELAGDLESWLKGDPISVRAISIPLLLGRMFRETHHAPILENWGLLWIWHAAVLIVLCTATNTFQWLGVESHLAYLTLWGAGLGTWAAIFWALRKRAGPITFVERQIAHVWAASVLASSALYLVEFLMELPVLSLSPVLPLIGGMVFVAKAGILSGSFYIQAAALFATPVLMVRFPGFGLTIFGAVSAACFFFPGLQYARRKWGHS